MYADVERVRSDTSQNVLRVVQQQGRVLLAAEANEQVAILLRHLQTLAADLIGPAGTTAVVNVDGNRVPGPGFKITRTDDGGDVVIGPGHYWVAGRLCELASPEYAGAVPVSYLRQPDLTPSELPGGAQVVYLDVWERHVGAAEDPDLVEPALGGPDSCSRTKQVWQVRLRPEPDPTATPATIRARWADVEKELGLLSDGGRLVAEVDRSTQDPTPCLAAPAAGYTGAENQLIHVEVHSGGRAGEATFKWAYDNASVAHRLLRVDGTTVVLAQPPRDVRKGPTVGTRVEVRSDEQVRDGTPGLLTTVTRVDDDADDVEVVLTDPAPFAFGAGAVDDRGRPRWATLRHWDHVATNPKLQGALPLVEDTPIPLAAGVVITFAAPSVVAGRIEPWTYRAGDHWTIPVRVATGDVIWPQENGGPAARPPEGIEHHYAPLALLRPGAAAEDVREFVKPAAEPI